MKKIRHLTAVALSIAMVLSSLVIPTGIYAAQSEGTIEVGVPVAGTISNEVKPAFYYWTDRAAKEDPDYPEQEGDAWIGTAYDQSSGEWNALYSEYSLTVDVSGFYLYNYSDNASEEDVTLGDVLICDTDHVKACGMQTGENYGEEYVYLQAGKQYSVIIYPYEETLMNFTFALKYIGDEISGKMMYPVYDSNGNEIGWDNTRLSWSLNSEGLLTVQGQGELFNEKGSYWRSLTDMIKEAEIKDGITTIEYNQFEGLINLQKVTIPASVKKIENEAFWYCTGLKEIVFSGDAPVFEAGTDGIDRWYDIFSGVTATAYYPAGNSTWTAAVRQNYGGNISWTAKELEPGSYYDVSSDAWYFDAVKYAGEKGLMSGTGAGKFSPDSAADRGMIVTILHRMEGTPQASDGVVFDDVDSGSYYAGAVSWAASEDIVSGYSDILFGPTAKITRQQLAVMLYRYAQYKGFDVDSSGDLSSFRDSGSIADYAEEAMSWAVAEGLISGTDTSLLLPAGNATRAQIAAILMRFCSNFTE